MKKPKKPAPKPTRLYVGEDGVPQAVAINEVAWREDVKNNPGTAVVRYVPATSASERKALQVAIRALRQLQSGVNLHWTTARDALEKIRKITGGR